MKAEPKSKAKTAAERQKAYRERRAKEVGEQRINTWISARALAALSSLAVRYGVTQKVMLERLILKEDDGLIVTTPRGAKRVLGPGPERESIVTQSQFALWDEPVVQAAAVQSKGRKPKGAA